MGIQRMAALILFLCGLALVALALTTDGDQYFIAVLGGAFLGGGWLAWRSAR